MKKTLLCALTTLAVLTSSMSVLAGPANDNKDVYNGVDNSIGDLYTTGGASKEHKTIIVTRTHDIEGTDITDEYVYVDQSTSAYSTALEVMFNKDLETGYYTATMGTVTDTSNTETVYFVVGDFDVDPEDKLTVLDQATAYGTDEGQTWYKKSFSKTITYDEYSTFKSIKLISGDGTKCIGAISFEDYTPSAFGTKGYTWTKTNLTGVGDVTIALQVYAIPEGSTDFSLYFSTDAVTLAE